MNPCYRCGRSCDCHLEARECEWCGGDFDIPWDNTRRKYCSRKCQVAAYHDRNRKVTK